MTITPSQNRTLFNDLAALFTGQLVLHEDAGYEQVRQLWNGRVKTQPAAIARCLTDLKRKYDPDDVFRSTVGHLTL